MTKPLTASMFLELVKNAKVTITKSDGISVVCEAGKFYLTFFVDLESGDLVIEDCCFKNRNEKWERLKYSEEQFDFLESFCLLQIEAWEEDNQIEDESENTCPVCDKPTEDGRLCGSRKCFEADNR